MFWQYLSHLINLKIMGKVKNKKAESGIGKQKLKTNFKKKVVKVRNRKADFCEQKLCCPICGTSNKTYRVLVQHCKDVHAGSKLVVACCIKDCGWHCGFSLVCFIHHMLYEHKVTVDGSSTIHLMQGKGDFFDHTARCLKIMKKRKIPNQNLLKLKIEMDHCRREAKKLIARAIKEGRVIVPDVAQHFAKKDYEYIQEIYDYETYKNLEKKFPVFDYLICENLVRPKPIPWHRLVAENIATHMFSDRALARLVDE